MRPNQTNLDLDLYLTPPTTEWLLNTLLQIHPSPPCSSEFIRQHTNLVPEWYRQLLTTTRSHVRQGTKPKLARAAKPRGGYHWQVPENIRRELNELEEEEEEEEDTSNQIG